MIKNNNKICSVSKSRKGYALLLTLAILIILTTLVYSLTEKLRTFRRRQQYIINYQAARYACDSGMKYALATAEEIKPQLITREESPDFSDLFYMNPQQRQEMLIAWAELKTEENLQNLETDQEDPFSDMMSELLGTEPNSDDPNSFGSFASAFSMLDDGTVDANSLTIPGPYGPEWPCINEPVEFEIGNTKVTIKIVDENAKLPLTWSIINDDELKRAVDDGLESFCRWMRMDYEMIDTLKLELEKTKDTKFFSRNLKPIQITEKKTVTSTSASKSSRTSRRSSRAARARVVTSKTNRPQTGHIRDFAMLFNSSLIGLDTLSQEYYEEGQKYEAPINYLGLFGTDKVNINTAPRHVLQAAFMFGGDEVDIAEEIIVQRQIKPFESIDELKQNNYAFSDSIRSAEPFITTHSTCFAIEVTAQCGNAVVSSTTVLQMIGSKIEKIAYMSN